MAWDNRLYRIYFARIPIGSGGNGVGGGGGMVRIRYTIKRNNFFPNAQNAMRRTSLARTCDVFF